MVQAASSGRCVRTGMRQSMPSSSIDNCAAVSDTLPDVACGQTKRPRSNRLASSIRPLAVEPQQLEDVAAPATEDEDVAAERVLGERGLHQCSQAIEALPHVGVAGHDPHTGSRWQADHARVRKAVNTLRRLASSTGPRSRTRTLPISISMVPLLDRAGGAGAAQ